MSHHTVAARKIKKNLRKQYRWEAGSQKSRCKWKDGKKICVPRPSKKGSGTFKHIGGLVATLGGLVGAGIEITRKH